MKIEMLRLWTDVSNYTDDIGVTTKMLTLYASLGERQMNISRLLHDENNVEVICKFIEVGLERILNTLMHLTEDEESNAIQEQSTSTLDVCKETGNG